MKRPNMSCEMRLGNVDMQHTGEENPNQGTEQQILVFLHLKT